jgi:hypothetical protein
VEFDRRDLGIIEHRRSGSKGYDTKFLCPNSQTINTKTIIASKRMGNQMGMRREHGMSSLDEK